MCISKIWAKIRIEKTAESVTDLFLDAIIFSHIFSKIIIVVYRYKFPPQSSNRQQKTNSLPIFFHILSWIVHLYLTFSLYGVFLILTKYFCSRYVLLLSPVTYDQAKYVKHECIIDNSLSVWRDNLQNLCIFYNKYVCN